MQKSPCLECTIVGRDKDKRNNHCAQCEKRKAYVMSLGGAFNQRTNGDDGHGRKNNRSTQMDGR